MLRTPTRDFAASSNSFVGSQGSRSVFPSDLAQGETSGTWEWSCELMRAVYYLLTTTTGPSTALDPVQALHHWGPGVNPEWVAELK